MNQDSAVHGGAVHEAARRWRVRPEEILDFSANINPSGPQPSVIEELLRAPIDIRWYPDSTRLIGILSEKLGVPAGSITIGNGSAALIFAVLRALRPKRALLLHPAFAEYQRAVKAAGAKMDSYLLREQQSFQPDYEALHTMVCSRGIDLVLLNNPHNPSGALLSRGDIENLSALLEPRRVCLVVDEAFIDYAPEASVLPGASNLSNVIVIRSLTKFYAIPGLRVGYAVCNHIFASRLKYQIEGWPVSSIALRAAAKALTDLLYEERTRDQNETARREFVEELRKIQGITVFPSSANFLLVKLRGSGSHLQHWLERHRILIRCCDSFTGLNDNFIRLAVRLPEENMRLAGLIKEWVGLESRKDYQR
ncbi:threonine-phosphate decarboxylase CobD [bacterium]|nr:threonine-phosphate decarboxylase CobD [bacterium]